MSIASQITLLVAAVSDKLNAMAPRLLPSGGAVGHPQRLHRRHRWRVEQLWHRGGKGGDGAIGSGGGGGGAGVTGGVGGAGGPGLITITAVF